LKDAGYDPGPIDGILGYQTKSALIKFQKANNLPEGRLDIETLKKLGVQ
jgi:peptidoglycan hydrolase-like protein with peptidoglycan-binding domain